MKKVKCPICSLDCLGLINGKCVWCLSPDELEAYYQGRRDLTKHLKNKGVL